MPWYHFHFKATHSGGRVSEHVRTSEAALPIEYSSDIQAFEEWAAKDLGAESAMLLHWHELKGQVRPQ